MSGKFQVTVQFTVEVVASTYQLAQKRLYTDPRMEFVTKELNRLTKAVVELEEAIERCKEITLV